MWLWGAGGGMEEGALGETGDAKNMVTLLKDIDPNTGQPKDLYARSD